MTTIDEALRLAEEALLRVEQNAEECMGDDGMVMVVPLDLYNELAESIPAIRAARAQEQEPVAWDLAEKVRRDLDRQSCPGVYMNIAVESIVKNYAAAIRGLK